MDRRAARVSEAQWSNLLEFLELNPTLARARGYNNSARGREESARLWRELSELLNAEGSGTWKTPKEWSIYVSNYKSKLKKTVAGINTDSTATGGGPPQSRNLTDIDSRFLALLGTGFGQPAPGVSVDPFPNESHGPGTSQEPLQVELPAISDEQVHEIIIDSSPINVEVASQQEDTTETPARCSHQISGAEAPPLPRRTRRTRIRSRPLAPLDEARRILADIEVQRAAADAANAQALKLIGENLGHLAGVASSINGLAQTIQRLAETAERFLSRH